MLLGELLKARKNVAPRQPLPMLGVGPRHPRLGHPFPRRFSDVRRRAARRIRRRSFLALMVR
jgi:hypothetical protein